MANVLIENTKLVSIANAIRNKTSLTDGITLDEMLVDIAMLPPLTIGEIPNYVQEEAERVAELVKALQNENTVTTIHATDIHVGSDSQSRASALHLAQGVYTVKKLVPIDGTFLHGDVVNGSASDSLETHLNNHLYARRTLSIADSEAEMGGNHDANIYNADSFMSSEELYKYVGRRNVKTVKPTTETDRNYFYLDNDDIRFICLNTADLKDISASSPQDGHHISRYQFQWLVDVLGSAESDGIRYILVLGHHPLHWYGSMPNVLTILNAYINGTSGSITTDGATVSFNFNGKNGASILGTVHGHTHNLIHGKVGDNEIIRLGTPNGCFGRNNEYGSSAYDAEFRAKYGEETSYAKTSNTAKDTAFVVNVWDLEQECVNSICYGAGYDRLLSWGSKVFYAVTNNLTNIATNNDSLSIEGGLSYSATLTPNDGYEISNIVVTMGGTDITSSAYSNGVITIAEVTGDIVITASAKKAPYEVDIASIGYNDGKRYSTSSGNLSNADGQTAINLIEIPRTSSEVVTIKLAGGVDWSANSNCTYVLCNNGALVTSGYLNTSKTDNSAGSIITVNGDGTVDIKLSQPTSAIATVNGIKVAGKGTGANAKITVIYE